MDCGKIGALIRSLRMEKGLTQLQVAEKLNLNAKTVSKWETGHGCPDISLVPELAALLGVEIERLIAGELETNEQTGGNMKKIKYYVCPSCANISLCTGNAGVSCCGRPLNPLELKKAENEQKLKVELIEDDWFITSDHPMDKENYIRFVAFANGAKLEWIQQYPEWDLQLRIHKSGHGQLIWYSPNDGLLYQLL